MRELDVLCWALGNLLISTSRAAQNCLQEMLTCPFLVCFKLHWRTPNNLQLYCLLPSEAKGTCFILEHTSKLC